MTIWEALEERDDLAKIAFQEILKNEQILETGYSLAGPRATGEEHAQAAAKFVARVAYLFADAMIKEGSK